MTVEIITLKSPLNDDIEELASNIAPIKKLNSALTQKVDMASKISVLILLRGTV